MRTEIFDTLHQRMADNADIFFLTADMGINLVEKIEKSYPDRYTNVGIAEQNLIAVAAGLCNVGYRPFAYTISNFLVHRCLEQTRNDIALHEYPVVLLGTSAGFDNAPLGPTHHIIDDWGALRAIPNIDIYCPSTKAYAALLVDRLLANGRPAYVRIAKNGADLPSAPADIEYLPGETASTILVTYGALTAECLAVHESRHDVSLLVFNRVRPIDEDDVEEILSKYKRAIVVEDHFAEVGLYAILCQIAHERRLPIQLTSRAPEPGYSLVVGQSPQYFFRKFGMDSKSLLEGL